MAVEADLMMHRFLEDCGNVWEMGVACMHDGHLFIALYSLHKQVQTDESTLKVINSMLYDAVIESFWRWKKREMA
jgi:hypothetical protein